MSFFKKNTLSPDEMVDAVVFVAGMSVTSYFLTGSLLTAMQREQMWDKRKHLYQGSCSTLFKAKLTSLAKDIAKHFGLVMSLLIHCFDLSISGPLTEKFMKLEDVMTPDINEGLMLGMADAKIKFEDGDAKILGLTNALSE